MSDTSLSSSVEIASTLEASGRRARRFSSRVEPDCSPSDPLLFTSLCAVAVAFSALALKSAPAAGSLLPSLAAVVLVFVCERRARSLASERYRVSASLLVFVFCACALGPAAAICAGAVSGLAHADRYWLRFGSWAASGALAGAIASLAAEQTRGALGSSDLAAEVLVASVAMLAATCCQLVSALYVLTLRRRGDLGSFRRLTQALLDAAALQMPLLVCASYTAQRVSIWGALILLAAAASFEYFLALYRSEQTARAELEERLLELERQTLAFAASLVRSLDARDHYTAGHSAAVALYARDLARALGLAEDTCRRIYLAGLVHDIGKVGIGSAVIEKPGLLNAEERALVERHPALGERILQPIERFEEIVWAAVRYHHERYDGDGYPDRLRGSEIPLAARIISVCDAYNAMTSNRPYRASMPPERAIRILYEEAGRQFDPGLVECFCELLASSDLTYRLGFGGEFLPKSALEIEALSARPAGLAA